MKKTPPSMDAWLKEAKAQASAAQVGMYLTHNGVVRATPRIKARNGVDAPDVQGMFFSYDAEKVAQVLEQTRKIEGIFHVRLWLNEGEPAVGDDIMFVLIGGDIRPRVVDALQYLVGRIKAECVTERELE